VTIESGSFGAETTLTCPVGSPVVAADAANAVRSGARGHFFNTVSRYRHLALDQMAFKEFLRDLRGHQVFLVTLLVHQ
jgi:hypothetical protein